MELSQKELKKLDKIHEHLGNLNLEISSIQDEIEEGNYCSASYMLGTLSRDNKHFIDLLDNFEESEDN